MGTQPESLRQCLRDSIPEIADAARYLDAAVSAHLAGRSDLAELLILQADMPEIREWTESLWGRNSPYVKVQEPSGPVISAPQLIQARMPTTTDKAFLHLRDGYNCRFCGIPVIRAEVRKRIKAAYPKALSWGTRNIECHAAFQAMWVQYDHIVPFKRGGSSDLSNLVVTCAPCNFGRMHHTIDEVGLLDPRERQPVRSTWDGLERFSPNVTSRPNTSDACGRPG
jgi:5-methylcytosine-specific restriction endonuclease McrA